MRREIVYQHVLRAVCVFAPEFWALGIFRYPRGGTWEGPGPTLEQANLLINNPGYVPAA